jgi:hypothetical protein
LTNGKIQIAEELVRASGLSPLKLGLRFDRVVVTVLDRLTHFAEVVAPAGLSVLVTISAPIRQPAKTVRALQQEIQALLSAKISGPEQSAVVHGNDVKMRLVQRSDDQAPPLIGFVHNPGTSGKQLLDLAEEWLRDNSTPGAG